MPMINVKVGFAACDNLEGPPPYRSETPGCAWEARASTEAELVTALREHLSSAHGIGRPAEPAR